MSEIFEVGDRVLYVSKDARRIVCGVVEVVDGNRVVVETGERKKIAFSHELTKLNMPDDFTKVDYVADIIARKIRERMMETPYKFTSALSPEDAERIRQANKAYGNLQEFTDSLSMEDVLMRRCAGAMPNPQQDSKDKVTDFVDAVCNIFDELKETFRKKNEQYATVDPLANFRTGALLNEGVDTWGAMYEEAKNYQRKHIAHVQNNKINGPKVDESLTDIAVYAVLMKYMHDRHYDKAIASWQEKGDKSNE